MKKYLLMMILPLFFIACTNPMLKWIETPADVSSSGVESGSGGRSGNDGDGNNDDVTPPPAGLNSDKAITGFSFGISGEEISIRGEPDQNGKTPIKAILPMGSPLNLTPSEIEIIGKSVSPQQGQPQNFSSPKDYRVFAEDGSFRDYVVEVTVRTPESAEIVWFDLEIPDRPNSPAEGVVNQPPVGSDTGEIIVHVPSGTSLENLTAKIAQTGQTIGDAQGHTDTKLAAVLTSNFSSTVNYTITS
ncbi:MAG: hypothetical protein LBG08_01060, partial [Spirochaetaceae bacterium]|nr:hypothetical protein [Spirochaetaceae bacterium]